MFIKGKVLLNEIEKININVFSEGTRIWGNSTYKPKIIVFFFYYLMLICKLVVFLSVFFIQKKLKDIKQLFFLSYNSLDKQTFSFF